MTLSKTRLERVFALATCLVFAAAPLALGETETAPEAATKKTKSAGKEAKAEKTAETAKDAGAGKETLPEVLDPSQFYGAAAMGYAAAKAVPQICAKLFCYCGCDVTDKHTSLLDCFTNFHGIDCHICQEEAMLALKMNREGFSIKEIQERVDQTYSSQYPFANDTDTYKKYKSNRLWNPQPDQGKDQSKSEKSEPPKLKPGAKAGECCGNHKKDEKGKK